MTREQFGHDTVRSETLTDPRSAFIGDCVEFAAAAASQIDREWPGLHLQPESVKLSGLAICAAQARTELTLGRRVPNTEPQTEQDLRFYFVGLLRALHGDETSAPLAKLREEISVVQHTIGHSITDLVTEYTWRIKDRVLTGEEIPRDLLPLGRNRLDTYAESMIRRAKLMHYTAFQADSSQLPEDSLSARILNIFNNRLLAVPTTVARANLLDQLERHRRNS